MIGKETFHKISIVFLYLFFVLSPFSISLSQIFAGASVFFRLLDFLWQKKTPRPETYFFFWILLYLGFLIYPLLNPSPSGWKHIFLKTEFGDVWMAFLLLHHTRLSRIEKTNLKKAVLIGAVFLILSGILSLFSPYRLAPFVMDGFQYVEGRRLPHQLGTLFGIFPFYLPIGFQSTHLTYGGMFAIYLPSIFLTAYRSAPTLSKKKKFKFLFFFLLILAFLGLVLLFLNQSRSVWFGLLFGLFLLSFQKKVSIKKYLPWLGIGFFLIAVLLYLFYHNNWLFQRAIDELFAKRSLENQRIWIHKMNFEILKDSFLLGVGSGNYPTEFIKRATFLVFEAPELYYDLSITPKSHAHFDFLHFWILGGFTSVFAYLSFLYLITKKILQVGKSNLFYLGFFSIIFAGSFQCFLLDDEVLLPFLGLLVLLPATQKEKKTRTENPYLRNQNKVFGILLLWMFTSSLGALYLTKIPAKELFFHRARTEHNFPMPIAQSAINANNANNAVPLPEGTQEIYFKLVGCLDHEVNFDSNPKLRVSPIQLHIHWEDSPEGNLPKTLNLEIRKRESFDQDKEYRVQKERIVKRDIFFNPRQIQKIQVHPNEYLGKGIEFVDFGFLFSWQGEKPILPRIEISENCD
ncbi:O-antigen ligase family protein [Leptospira sp. 2 VSF19]|uniref:O-antigen ligase family protein n=1 Tax=Leptospira soteropolitanensis TaxID=2950025 RepID=A0AAW5VI95_9LEPT|nr:O-antigen ligase family protein [Leptospira soteropolitanensis]MCW7492264.1 O-antigen ligase family protein [Leptospira soteropolitanensis]MCW7499846.1 O-antigen ligase family protein [Leptospira soteropolitanensis]MCW7522097.1 O-antigen ligase family protein [Leptospira soteropolitanensis]MCW7525951.1 O-antigen ligase family protein [Leptospira soteropolitanensis]MCW7529935.1 O-antigen ligase family protein [Leptospira soteropolitanensis]